MWLHALRALSPHGSLAEVPHTPHIPGRTAAISIAHLIFFMSWLAKAQKDANQGYQGAKRLCCDHGYEHENHGTLQMLS